MPLVANNIYFTNILHGFIINLMTSLKDFYTVINTDSMNKHQRKQRFTLILFAELVIVAFMTFVTVYDFRNGNSEYELLSVLLLGMYTISLLLTVLFRERKIANIFFCLTITANFVYSFYIKGNNGIGSIWLLLLPMLSMYVIGIAHGLHSSIIATISLIVLFIIPYTREQLLQRYSVIFLFRYFALYVVGFILSTFSMYTFHTLRLKENEYQQELEAAVTEEHNKVVAISMQTIISISNAVEAKNVSVGKHSMRVAHFACILAEKLGWPENEIRRLHTIAMLHDIGKIGVESKILNKDSVLTEEEFEKMKKHTTIGGNILKDFTIIPHVDLGANYHHEHYDGKGYPSGLSGEEIPIEARIVCIADSFDSMKYPRGYKVNLNSEDIKAEFLKGRGTQFDPNLTDKFLTVCEENNWFADYEV